MVQPQFLVVVFPAQGHINPGLQFAKRLIRTGAEVTFVTTISAHSRMSKAASNPAGLSFAPYSDGYDDGFKHGLHDADHFLSEISRCGKQAISDLVVSAANEGRPFSCIVYSLLLPWAAEAAHQLQLPSALLWIQPATVFDIYYYYFHGYDDAITNNGFNDGPSWSIELPGLPLKLKRRDLPSFMDAGNAYAFAIPLFKDQFEKLELGRNPKILVNTFDALEPEALNAIGNDFDLIGIGPLIPSAFLDGRDPSDTSFGGDLIEHPKDYYLEWLSSKPKGSVIYVSFGSMSVLAKPQMEKVGRALLETGRPFLWVIREKDNNNNNGEEKKEEDELSCREELEKLGKIVPWCSQLDVLSNTSCGCFVTHCGWNSTLESMVCGVPLVGFPQWTDQGTNAKLIEDVWKIGLRVMKNKDGIVESDEFKRCLELVMGDEERGEEMRRNAKKLMDLARESAKEGGSSDKNLKFFVDEINQKERAASQVN